MFDVIQLGTLFDFRCFLDHNFVFHSRAVDCGNLRQLKLVLHDKLFGHVRLASKVKKNPRSGFAARCEEGLCPSISVGLLIGAAPYPKRGK